MSNDNYTVSFQYNGKPRVVKIEKWGQGPSGQTFTGQSFTNGMADGYRSYSVEKIEGKLTLIN